MSVYKLAILLEDVPGCGSRFPGYERPHGEELPREERVPSSKADDLPQRSRTLIAAGVDAVRLFQLGIAVGGELHPLLASAAERLYQHSGCSEVSTQTLFELIQRHWPVPPPSPPMRLIEILAVSQLSHPQSSPALDHMIKRLLCLYGPCPQPLETMGPGEPH